MIHGLTVGRGGGGINHNSVFGEEALLSNTSGHRNTAIGSSALRNNESGTFNTAVGRLALQYNIIGSDNTAVGFQALRANETGYENIALGSDALFSNINGNSNTAIGMFSLASNSEGDGNTAVGRGALITNTTGFSNVAVGLGALASIANTSENTAIGGNAGSVYPLITRGTFLGFNAYPNANGLENITAIGYNARPTKSNQIVFGNASVAENLYYGNLVSGSDGRYKKNISENVVGLDFILKLRPVTYNMDVHQMALLLEEDMESDQFGEKIMKTPDEATLKARDQKSSIYYSGFIAQEVETVAREVGYDFSGVIAPENDHEYYSLDYISFTVPIVKAIQEQQAQIDALSPEGIDALREELSELRAENIRMQGQINDITSLLENLGVDLRQSTGPGTNDIQQQSTPGNPRLEQNTPNPFHANTVIRYFLPEGTNRAQIKVTDLSGTQVMAFILEHQGAGQVLIHGRTLPSGNYVYTLVVDGRIVDSKRMVLL